MKKFAKLSATILGVILMIGLGIGHYFYTVAIHRDTRQGQSQFDKQVKLGMFNLAWYETQRAELVSIQSDRGYKLDGFILYHPDTVQNTMIICHGLGADKWTMLKVANVYMEAGFNTLFYDHTRHGSSGGDLISYGHFEKLDLQQVVEYTKERFPGGKIGIHGESFGGATSLMHAGLNELTKDVSFYVIDCAYSDLKSLFEVRLKDDFGLPNLGIVEMASMITYMREEFAFSDVSPKNVIKNVRTPIFFIHGSEDTYVPTWMSEELYEVKPGEKELWIVPEAAHAQSYATDRNGYRQKVHAFIQRVMPVVAQQELAVF
jgi:uncharacterized protein